MRGSAQPTDGGRQGVTHLGWPHHCCHRTCWVRGGFAEEALIPVRTRCWESENRLSAQRKTLHRLLCRKLVSRW